MYGGKKHLEAFVESKTKTLTHRLQDLLEELKRNNVSVKTKDYHTPLQHLAVLIAEAHQHYSGMDYEYKPGD